MKKKFIALILAILLPFSYNINYCFALKNNDGGNNFNSEEVKILKGKLRKAAKEKNKKNNDNLSELNSEDIKMLQEKIKKLENEKNSGISTWKTILDVAKFIFSVGLGITLGVCSLWVVTVLVPALVICGITIFSTLLKNYS